MAELSVDPEPASSCCSPAAQEQCCDPGLAGAPIPSARGLIAVHDPRRAAQLAPAS